MPQEQKYASEKRLYGHSASGKPLYVYRLGTGKAHTAFVGSLSGCSAPSIIADHLYETLLLAAEDSGRIGKTDLSLFLSENALFFIPFPNPDSADTALGSAPCGYVGDPFRKSRPAMNFNHRFVKGSAKYGSDFCGAYPEDLPESRALAGFLRTTRPKFLICFEEGEEYLLPDLPQSDVLYLLCRKTIADKALIVPLPCSAEGWFAEESGGASLRAAVRKSDTPERFCGRIVPFLSLLLKM